MSDLHWCNWQRPWLASKATAADCVTASSYMQGIHQQYHEACACLVPTQHWVDQVEMHTQPGSLRKTVLLADGSKSAAAPTASQLAWDCDLVSQHMHVASKFGLKILCITYGLVSRYLSPNP